MNWSGVDLFFILSGFLIGGILLDLRQSESRFRPFFVRRAFRIIPLYLAVMFVMLPFHVDSDSLAACCQIQEWYWYATISQNIWMAIHNSWNIWYSVWSLGVEEQFYIILPFIIWFIPSKYLRYTLLTLIAGAIAHRSIAAFSATSPSIAMHVLFSMRADTLLIGVLCAMLVRDHAAMRWINNHIWSLYCVLALAGACFAIMLVKGWSLGTIQLETFGYDIVAIFYASILLIAVVDERGAIAAITSYSSLRWLGRRAYFIFLVHNSLPLGVFYVLGRTFSPTPVNWGLLAASFAIVLVLSEISWRYFEEPLIGIGHQLARRRPLATA